MEHVNFLERKTFDLRHLELNYLSIILLISGLIFLVGVYSFVQRHRLVSLQEKVVVLERQSVEGGQVMAASGLRATLQGALPWSVLIHKIGEKIPGSVQLTSIVGSLHEGRVLRLEGVASNMKVVADLQTELGKIDRIKNMSLVSSEVEESEGGKSKIKFKMEGKLL